MAAASGSHDDDRPRPQRRSSLRLPPDLSELRAVLLGNSWFERSSVGNFIFGAPVFDTQTESDGSEKVSGKIDKTRICLINTPDLLHRKLPDRKLKKQVGLCMRLAAPGPHVFLLVLQAEDFTEEHNMGLCRVLRLFSDRAFDHSLVLISSREQGSGSVPPSLNNFNRMCKYNYQKLQQLSRPELLAQMAQITLRTLGAHVSCADAAAPDVQTPPAAALELKIVLLGDSDHEKTKLGNFIIGDQVFSPAHSRCVSACGEWRGKRFTVVKTPDVAALSTETVRTLCPSAAAVLLLVVKTGFTEGDRKALMSILPWFGEDPVKYSMVILSHDCIRMTDPLATLLNTCGKRHYCVDENNRALLMKRVENIAHKNKESLNMVLCGSSRARTSSAAEAFLGLSKVGSKHQLDVCGRQVSLVQLPALYRKRHEAKLNESFRCVAHCDPEGVHAFLLVLPLRPPGDEDKKELQSIQSVFGSGVTDFTLILFVLDSGAADPAHVDFQQSEDFQELCQRGGGRYVVVTGPHKQQVTEVLDAVEKMIHTQDKACSYTTETFIKAQIKTIVQLQKLKDRRQNICDEDAERPECLRIVLIGRTGCGKSASGNTILGREEFKSELNQMSVTKHCQKAKSEVNGRPVVVVDTPGVFDTEWSHEEVYEELVKCVTLLAPGPHVFLLVINIDKFTEEHRKTLRLIKKGFGQRSERFTIVLLTGGDKLEKENMSIKDFMENKCDPSFKRLISDCGGRYHVLNNLDRHNRTQVPELLDKICSMVKDNGGSCFTNEMLQQSEAALQTDMERIMKENEEMKREREELQRKHEEELRAMKNKMETQREESELERKLIERELREKEAKIQELEDRIQGNREREEQEERLEALEQQIKSKEEETVNKELVLRWEELRRERQMWGKERKDWRQQQLLESLRMEKTQLQRLKEEFEEEKEKYERKQREDLFRKEQEESERREVEEKYNEQVEELKEKQEEEARRKAEELNKFKPKYEEDLEALMLQHEQELEQTEERHREEMKRKENEKEREKKQKYVEDLRWEHEEQIKNLKKKHRRNCKVS